MDPVTTGALVTAVNAAASGAGGEAGRRALESLAALYRRVLRRDDGEPGGGGDPPEGSPVGSGDLVGADGIPYDDAARLRDLAALLVERARRDPAFGRDLAAWLSEYGAQAAPSGEVRNTIAEGARITGPVIQGRDFSGPITFGSS
ncbi:hypothetical protein RKE29_08255 [Streptomyces sp. B1866]|uniref:hypothetical protein n=1 Tax=Streptomyces sp. B1866 TaxID=3075431 RepID=UPI00288D8954|nr:hypothetical protein [Streptomyces sp. B1866]MDT3396634.1 hypothetical protein [Streptomyces sp. B1866]